MTDPTELRRVLDALDAAGQSRATYPEDQAVMADAARLIRDQARDVEWLTRTVRELSRDGGVLADAMRIAASWRLDP